MSPSAVEVRNLTKRFGGFTAVDGISFDIGRGEILGLLGPRLLYTTPSQRAPA